MAFKHGKGTIFKLDDSTPTLNDISAYVNNVDFPREVDTPETTTFGNDDRTYIAGLRGATISITGFWDETVDGYLAGIVGQATSSTFEYGPQGGSTGDIKYSGEAFVTNYTQGSPVDGVTTFSLDLQITGAVTRGSF
jgi:predicted secreted protein